MTKKYFITSESVTEGHADKICDQIADAILDNLYVQDPMSRVAIECLVTTGSVHVAGEVTTHGFADIQRIVRDTLREIGYTDPAFGIDCEDAGVWISIHGQSPDISQGVTETSGHEQGAGDQGCLKKGSLIRTNKGFVPIEKINEGDYVVTNAGLKKVLKSQKTGRKKLIEISLSNGMNLVCTPEHRILCYSKNGTTYWKEAQQLNKNDFICILKPSTNFNDECIKSIVKREQFFTKYNHKIFGPEELLLDENIGYAMGELIGDGHVVRKGSMEIAFGNNISHVPIVKSLLETRIPNQWRIIKNENNTSLKIDSVLVRKHFENFGITYSKSPQKTTPKDILVSPQSVIKSYLRGLFDSDGTIVSNTGRNKNNIRIRVSSSSLQLLRETQLLVNDFGVKSSIVFNRPVGTPVGKDKRYKSKYDNYVLSIVGFESYHNFAKEIGFLDPKKKIRLEEYIKNNQKKLRNSRGIFLIPHPRKKELIDEERVGKNLPFGIMIFRNKKEMEEDDVYDLEIEDTHLFTANGIFVHNSMYGYACNETPELMPLPIMLAHKLTRKMSEVRKNNDILNLGPDGKSQVTIEYEDSKPKRIEAVVVSQQHKKEISEEQLKKEIFEKVIKPVCEYMMDTNTKVHINPTGSFVIGGPEGDSGVTGRKIIVDTYGGVGRHGGGGFSGKDCTKVDRSAAYMCRYVAKNIVAAGLADKCEVALSYAIGVAQPTSINVDCFGTNKIPEEKISELVKRHFKLTPRGIIDSLNLRRPIYKKTSVYGHFGRHDPDFTWEKTDKVELLKKEAGL